MPPRLPTLALALTFMFVAGVPLQFCAASDLSSSQREAIEAIIHDYLIHNPDVLVEALRGAEDKLNREADAKAERALADRHSEVFDDPATPVGGNPRGDVTIVEFFDYRCPYCKQVLPALQALLVGFEMDLDQARYLDYPNLRRYMTSVGGNFASVVARATARDPAQAQAWLVSCERGIEKSGRHASRLQAVNLIFHQGNQRGHDDGKSRPCHRG